MLYIRKHFTTITRHRHLVIRHCFKCGILWQGLRHDLSKYSPVEFLEGIRYYRPDRSPNKGEWLLPRVDASPGSEQASLRILERL